MGFLNIITLIHKIDGIMLTRLSKQEMTEITVRYLSPRR